MNFSKAKVWWNKGRNERLVDENSATWSELWADDLSQLTRTDEAFASGTTTGWRTWRPLKAFTPRMVATGPSPLIRQLAERPFRSVFR